MMYKFVASEEAEYSFVINLTDDIDSFDKEQDEYEEIEAIASLIKDAYLSHKKQFPKVNDFLNHVEFKNGSFGFIEKVIKTFRKSLKNK